MYVCMFVCCFNKSLPLFPVFLTTNKEMRGVSRILHSNLKRELGDILKGLKVRSAILTHSAHSLLAVHVVRTLNKNICCLCKALND